MLNRDQPLWLPPGSVRAIMGLLIVLAFVIIVLRSNIVIEAKDVITIVILVLGFYFIAKAAAAAGRGGDG